MRPARVFDYVQGGLKKLDGPAVGEPVEDALSVTPRVYHTGSFKQLQVTADHRRVLVKMRGYLTEAPFAFGKQTDDLQPDVVAQCRKQRLRRGSD